MRGIEKLAFERGGRRIINKGLCRKARGFRQGLLDGHARPRSQKRLWQVERIDGKRIEKTPVGGMIRARTLGIARKQRMQRIEPNSDGACSRCLLGEKAQ